MRTKELRNAGFAVTALLCFVGTGFAQDIKSASDTKIEASFDIVKTRVTTSGGNAVFHTHVRADAGKLTPKAIGKFEGSENLVAATEHYPTSGDDCIRGQGDR